MPVPAIAPSTAQEVIMSKSSQGHPPRPMHAPPSKVDTVTQQKQRAEQAEVAGRHKNAGRNDNIGHKTSR